MSYIIFYGMQTYDAIILKKKIWYLDPTAICKTKHASPKWMKDDVEYLNKVIWNKEGKTKGTKKISSRDLHKCCGLHIAYDVPMGRHGCHICVIPSSKSNINQFIINHCSDPCLQNVRNIFFIQKSLDCFPTITKARKNSRIGLVGLVNQEIPRIHRYTTIVSEFLIFPKQVMLISLDIYI